MIHKILKIKNKFLVNKCLLKFSVKADYRLTVPILLLYIQANETYTRIILPH